MGLHAGKPEDAALVAALHTADRPTRHVGSGLVEEFRSICLSRVAAGLNAGSMVEPTLLGKKATSPELTPKCLK